MRKLLVALLVTLGCLSTASHAEATTNLAQSQAIMSTITGCYADGTWWVDFHLYSTFDGGLMNVNSSNFSRPWWQPASGAISSDSLFVLSLTGQPDKASWTATATLKIVQTTWPGGTVYRSASRTAYRPNC